jgi:choice-of-anchor B domain-containing protein
MNLYGGVGYSSCWSYIHSDGREYAIEFANTGASIVRLTDPAHPVEVEFIPLRTSDHHEGRQYRNWFYVTTEVYNGVPAGDGLEIIRMTDPDHPKVVGSFHPGIDWAHTVDIDTTRAILYAAGAPDGMAIYSLADPENPVLIGTYPGNGFSSNYIHTIYTHGTRGYASRINAGMETVFDLTDPAHPVVLADFRTPFHLTHSSWTSQDQRYLYVADEYHGPSLGVYDIQDLSNIRRVYQFEELGTRTMPHDPVIKGNLAFVSYYSSGARVWDVSNPAWPAEIGYYDTYPGNDADLFHGAWEAAPMFPSGIFIASDIEAGLYVLRPNLNYAIVRGTVTEAPSGPIVPGTVISQTSSGATAHAFSDGRYAIAVDPGASVTLQTSQYAFDPLIKTVAAAAGTDQTLNLKIRRSDAGTLTGIVRRASDQSLLSEADVQILGTPLSAKSGADGAYIIPSIPIGTYQVRCARPGQVPRTVSVVITKAHTTTTNYSLASPLFYDDAESDRGWTLGAPDDDATGGLWIRAVPLGTQVRETGEQVQPGQDRTPDPGTMCFVTGNGTPGFPFAIGEQRVRGGKTTLTSPILHLGGVQDPRIGFWRWYGNYFVSFTPDDPFVTQLSSDGGQTWTSIDSVLLSEPGWKFVEFPVASYISNPGDVMVRFIAQDRGDISIVEAALDDFSYYSGSGTVGPAARMELATATASASVGRLWPSPTRGAASIELSLARSTEVRADLFDVQGKMVRAVYQGILPAGAQALRWDGKLGDGTAAAAGVYWFRIRADGLTRDSRLVVVR